MLKVTAEYRRKRVGLARLLAPSSKLRYRVSGCTSSACGVELETAKTTYP